MTEMKKELIHYGVIALIAAFLYITGWYVPVIGFLQRGLLATGLIRPDTEVAAETATGSRPVVNLDIELLDADGQVVNMAEFRGKVLFVNLWATWCPPCLAEMPNIDQLYRELEPEGVVFIMLSVDRDFTKAVTHVRNKAYHFPVYRPRAAWPAALNASTIPSTFVLDRSGAIVLTHHGMAQYNTKDFKAFLRGLL